MDKFLERSFDCWDVPTEFEDALAGYLLNGWEPGGMLTSLLANDAWKAIARIHPGNTIHALKATVGWIANAAPPEAVGSYDAVYAWCKMSKEARQKILEDRKLIMTAWDHLKDTEVR